MSNKQEEQQIINDAPVILETILSEYGEVNAIAEVHRLVNVAKSAIQRAKFATEALDAVPIGALKAIEEIAPLIAHDKLHDPAKWVAAWNEVTPWLADWEEKEEEDPRFEMFF